MATTGSKSGVKIEGPQRFTVKVTHPVSGREVIATMTRHELRGLADFCNFQLSLKQNTHELPSAVFRDILTRMEGQNVTN